MRREFLLLYLVVFCFMTACDSSTSSTADPSSSESEQERSIDDPSELPAEASNNAALPQSHNCQIAGDILEDNQFWARREARLLAIKADSTTNTEGYGPSHTIFEVYNSENCEQIRRTVLPVDGSPDFPYYIAQILYNSGSHLVAIYGFSQIYVYNIATDNLAGPVSPNFNDERPMVDAQSGMIRRLEVWEDFMVGYAQDEGTFVFDLSDAESPKAMLPFAEYKSGDSGINSLFLLPSEAGGLQAMVPFYDINEDVFSINPLLEEPSNMDTNVNRGARNNRFLVLRNPAKEAMAFDLQERKKVELPDNLHKAATQEILGWLKR